MKSRTRNRYWWTVACLLGVLSFIVGLDEFDPPDNAAAQNARRVVLSAKFSFRGVVTVSGSFDENKYHALANSCADWAKGLPGPSGPYEIFYGPTTGDGEPPKDFGGHKVKIVVTVDHYHGPGTYSVSTEGRPIAHLELSADNYQYYTSGTGTGAQAVVKPDASGSVSFGAANSQTGKLIGTIDWTCRVQ